MDKTVENMKIFHKKKSKMKSRKKMKNMKILSFMADKNLQPKLEKLEYPSFIEHNISSIKKTPNKVGSKHLRMRSIYISSKPVQTFQVKNNMKKHKKIKKRFMKSMWNMKELENNLICKSLKKSKRKTKHSASVSK